MNIENIEKIGRSGKISLQDFDFSLNSKFQELNKNIQEKEDKYFCQQILKYKELAGDGKCKYVSCLIVNPPVNPIMAYEKDEATMTWHSDLIVRVTEKKPESGDSFTKFSDKRFKLLIKYAEGNNNEDN